MGKRTFSIVLALALVAGVFSALPATAQEAPAQPTEVPPVVQIEDPYGDANGQSGDQQLGVDGGSQTDIGKVWFTHDGTSVSAHFLTEGPPNANSLGFQFVVAAGEAGCLLFEGYFDGTTYTSENFARVRDNCNTIDPVVGTFVFAPGPGGEGGLATINVPREGVPSLAEGSVISGPSATTWIFAGGEQITPTGFRGVRSRIDDTKVGTDYPLSSGGGEVVEPKPEPTEEPPGKSDPPGKGKKKGCKKGKGKKKGACPEPPQPPAAPACPAYVPGEMGAEAETTVVTDDATEEKPIEIDVPLGLATGTVGSDRRTRAQHNVQIDSKLAEAGFYARLESPAGDDPDLYVYYASGKQAAVAGGFNPLLAAGPLPNPTNHATINSLNGRGTGGHSEFTAEQIDGLRSPDCQGWTLDLVNWGGRGGTYKLKLWVGEIQNDPAPEQQAESESALDTFFDLLMSR
ncbi:MAG: hypothetical protein M3277_01460 [Actinomycetota bacterium]|nr:hypothetical protein [Actinomycetota bacterium]